MDISRIHKKIAEARSFLNDLTKQEQRIFGDKEQPFDRDLSAFLSAGMSVRNGFHARQDRARNREIKAWRESWEQALTPRERSLYEFLREDRNREVHNSDSRRRVGQEEIKLSLGEHRIDGAILTISGPPATLIGPQSPATVYKATYRFMINGIERNVTEACAAYLALLEKMVAQFEADHP